MDILTKIRVPVMFVGNAGSGKSVIVSDKMNNLSENYAVTNVPFNFYTTSGFIFLFTYYLLFLLFYCFQTLSEVKYELLICLLFF